MRPRLLDLYCKAGGAGKGYHDAGFTVVGVDVEPQPRYPFEFVQADALEYVAAHGREFDAIHASPPCQAHTTLRYRTGGEYPDLIAATRALLVGTGRPWAIENVEGAPLVDSIRVCGTAFGLGAAGRDLRRHRRFESNVPMLSTPCAHARPVIGVYGTGGGGQMTRGYKARPGEDAEALGIDWMTRAELAQAIPPAYTRYVGSFLLAAVERRLAA